MTPLDHFLLLWLLILLGLILLMGIPTILAEEEIITVNAWVVDGVTYREVPIHFGTQEFVSHQCREGAQGCYLDPRIHGTEVIFIVLEKANHYPNYGGCNVIWHELLHAMGYDHEWMFKNLKNKDCSYSYIHKYDLIEEKYGGLIYIEN